MVKKLMETPEVYFRTHKIGELYFRFIKGTPLVENGWTGELLARTLEEWGFIKVTLTQGHDSHGHFAKPQRVYYALPGKRISRKELVGLILARCPKPPTFLQRVFKKEDPLKCVHLNKDGKTCGFMRDATTGLPAACDGFDFPCPGYLKEDS